MKALVLALTAALLAAASPSEPPRGEWYNADLKAIEVLPGGSCVRLWLEERTYSIVPGAEGRFTGTYRNVIRATPVGPASFAASCKFPAPGTSPVASQMRLWSLVGTPGESAQWRVRAQPGAGGGDFKTFPSDEFETRLTRRGDKLVDGTSDLDDATKSLVFRPAAPVPTQARTALEDTLNRLNGGSCLEVMAALAPKPGVASQMCQIRQKLDAFLGKYLSATVDSTAEFDRVPDGFPEKPPTGWRRQRGVFVVFTGRYEKNPVPGNAVLYEEGGKWRVALLWF